MNSTGARDTPPFVKEQTPYTRALNLDALENAVCRHEPYDHVIVPNFVNPKALPAIHSSYPKINKPGSYPYQSLEFGAGFSSLLDELQGPEMRVAIEKAFDLDLQDRPTTVTVRGQCQQKDGRIHTDSVEKIITVLLYLNRTWEKSGGLLRLLRNSHDIENYVVEVPPAEGTLLAFRRSQYSWHGHKPYVGERRVLQLNWVTDTQFAKRENWRHAISAFLKRFGG